MKGGALLAPLGGVYGGLAALRVALYGRGVLKRQRLAGPVISVGNLRLGGSGKTPVVELVARVLHDQGLPVAVLSRGYGGSFAGEALVVSEGGAPLADARAAGDEPVMLARHLPGVVVAVGRRRDVVGRAVEARFGRRVHVLDDGFQHLRLHRDLDLLCADAADLGDRPLPAGRLRERPAAAARASALIVPAGQVMAALRAGQDVFHVQRRTTGFHDRDGGACPPPARAFLLAAVARPERFAADTAAHCAVVGRAFFRDHHWFTEGELQAAAAQAADMGADAIVTTAKDAERLPAAWAPLPVRILRVAAEVEEAAAFRELLLAVARGVS
jgi:tetraacyldisaccharide 4'-kinase